MRGPKKTFVACAVVTLLAIGGAYAFVLAERVIASLPAFDTAAATLRAAPLALSSEVFDRNGRKIGEFSRERRYYVPLKALPKHVVQAFLSAEDKDFFAHDGVNLRSMARAFLVNLVSGGPRQGGSTITQQLARIYFLDQEKTLQRKVKEAVLAWALQRRLSKEQILEIYLNKIFLGNQSYGIEAAARNYFRKSATQLNVGEAAMLAGLPKAPSRDAPNRHYARAKARQAFVLQRLYEDGALTKAERDEWLARSVVVAREAVPLDASAPYFLAAVREEINDRFEFDALASRGLRIYTTLDFRQQDKARLAIQHGLARVRQRLSPTNSDIEGALLSLDPFSGAVLAMQGGSEFSVTQYNRVVARRPLGSLYMPLYFALALERGFTLASPVSPALDEATGAPLSLFDALQRARPSEGEALYASLGEGSVLDFTARLGVEFRKGDLLGGAGPLYEGGGKAEVEQVARAYAAFANGGYRIDPYLIERIETSDGQLLYEHRPTKGMRVMAPQTAYIMSEALRAIGRSGPAKGLRADYAVASGATEDAHDSWCAAALPQHLTVIWLGSEHGKMALAPTSQAASMLAQSLWRTYAKSLPKNALGHFEPAIPHGISFARLPPAKQGVKARLLPFLSGTEPSGRAAHL